MKIFVDDERPAPEGWVHAKTFHAAYDIITENAATVTHIAFDWCLSFDVPSYNGINLLRELIRFHEIDEPIFHQARENYTCHSSDSNARDEMKFMLDEVFGIEYKSHIKINNKVMAKPSKLAMLRKAKRR